MQGLFICVIAATLAVSAACAGPPAMPSVPVTTGGEADADACAATGIVSGLRGGPGSFLAVRGGPGLRYDMLGRLEPGARVWICEARTGWLGIVYGPPDRDCDVSSPAPERRPYAGPCASGWVSERYVRHEAG